MVPFWGTFPSSHEVIANHGIQQTIHRHLPWKRTRSTRYVFYTNIDPIFWYAPIRSCVYLNDREWSWLYISTPVLVLWIGCILWFTSVCQNHVIYTYIYIYAIYINYIIYRYVTESYRWYACYMCPGNCHGGMWGLSSPREISGHLIQGEIRVSLVICLELSRDHNLGNLVWLVVGGW